MSNNFLFQLTVFCGAKVLDVWPKQQSRWKQLTEPKSSFLLKKCKFHGFKLNFLLKIKKKIDCNRTGITHYIKNHSVKSQTVD